jgi:hypothetical protein
MNPDTLSGDYQVAWEAGMGGATPLEIADFMALANRDFNLTQDVSVTVPATGLIAPCSAGAPNPVTGSAETATSSISG